MTEDELNKKIETLTNAIASGTLRAKDKDGKEHVYRSVNQMIQARQLLQQDLAGLLSPSRKRRALSIFNTGVR